MYIFVRNAIQTGLVATGTLILMASSVLAQQAPEVSTNREQTAPVAETNNTLGQVTSVSQLSDVQPTDWAFQALQSLVERYGVIAGYPDGTYRGNRALTRYEFAAGLNAALDRVNELIAAGTADLVRKEDLATLQKLQTEFSAELATLRGRVDTLEAQTAELEANQFSTTTKLTGSAIVAAAGSFGENQAVPSGVPASGQSVDDNVTFAQRVILNFETSFSGKDLLTTSLYASNLPNFSTSTGTRMARLGYELDTPDTNNDVGLYFLQYSFPVFGDKGTVTIAPTLNLLSDIVDSGNPFFDNVSNGAISAFGLRNPIYRQGIGGGAGFTYNFSKAVNLSLAYIATNADDPNSGAGLFDGSYGAIAQLGIKPSDAINLQLTYVRSYNALNLTEVGSTYSNDPFDGANTSADSYGVEASFQLSPKFAIGGWVGYTQADAKNGANRGADANILNYAVTLAFPDLGKEGNLGGVIIGQPPRVTSNDIGSREDDDSSLHVEAFYRYQINDNVSITPGLLVITNPEHNDNNDTIYVGTLRTTLTF